MSQTILNWCNMFKSMYLQQHVEGHTKSKIRYYWLKHGRNRASNTAEKDDKNAAYPFACSFLECYIRLYAVKIYRYWDFTCSCAKPRVEFGHIQITYSEVPRNKYLNALMIRST